MMNRANSATATGSSRPACISATHASHDRRRIAPYRPRISTRRWSSRAAIAPDVRWIATIVARSSLPASSSRVASASSSSWVRAPSRRAGGSGTVVVRTRARSASIAALTSSSEPGRVRRLSIPIRTVGRTASTGSPSSAATAAASASPSGRRRPIAAQGSSGLTSASCTIRATGPGSRERQLRVAFGVAPTTCTSTSGSARSAGRRRAAGARARPRTALVGEHEMRGARAIGRPPPGPRRRRPPRPGRPRRRGRRRRRGPPGGRGSGRTSARSTSGVSTTTATSARVERARERRRAADGAHRRRAAVDEDEDALGDERQLLAGDARPRAGPRRVRATRRSDELAQRRQVRLGEEPLERDLGALGRVDVAVPHPLAERVRAHVDELDLVGASSSTSSGRRSLTGAPVIVATASATRLEVLDVAAC